MVDENFQSVLKDLAEGSSLHGIPKIVSSKQTPVKVLWFLLFLATFTVFGLQLYNLFSAYYSWPIQTSVSLKFSPLQYPAVTFCNMNPVKKSRAETHETLQEVINPKRVKDDTHGLKRRRKRDVPATSSESQLASSSPITPDTQTGTARTTSFSGTATSATGSSHQDSMTGSTAFLDTFDTSVVTSSQDTKSTGRTLSGASEETTSSTHQESLTSSTTSFDNGQKEVSETAGDGAGSGFGIDSIGSQNWPTSSSTDLPGSEWSTSDGTISGGTGSTDGSSSGGSYSGSGFGSYGSYNDSGNGTEYYYDYWGSGYWSSGFWSSGTGDYDYYNFFNDSSYDWSYYGSGDSSGIYGYLYDQFFMPKDQWEERIQHFNEKFKMEPLESREEMGHSVDDMVITASFAGRLQNVSRFERVTTTDFGNCYTMTSPKYIAMKSGPSYGIKLTLNLEIDEYIKNFASGYGIRMVFHEPGTLPLPAEEGMTLSPGYETHIGLKMVKVEREGPPYGYCSDGAEFFQKYKIRYSITACFRLCRIQRAIQYCGCIPANSPDLNFTLTDTRICQGSNGKDSACLLLVDIGFEDNSIVEDCDCVSPCQEVVYEKTMSGRRWPNDDYLENVLMTGVCEKNSESFQEACQSVNDNLLHYERYRYNFLQVLIYFEDLNYESIKQEPLYQSVRFLSDIGGAMGLFLGASVLSFVEILQLILEMVMFIFRRKFHNKKVRNICVTEKGQPDF